jgi:hypothetical protein
MICEARRQTYIKDLPEAAGGVVYVGGHAVRIDRTPQHLGGSRAWFRCPACDRRCAILYPVRCRKCLGLNYRSEHLSPNDRATLKAQRLRARLGDTSGNLSHPIPSKPKWMRWHTYFSRRAEIREADARHLEFLGVYLAELRGTLCLNAGNK